MALPLPARGKTKFRSLEVRSVRFITPPELARSWTCSVWRVVFAVAWRGVEWGRGGGGGAVQSSTRLANKPHLSL